MEGILKVTPEVLITTSDEFKTQGANLRSLTSQMTDMINGLPSSWVGEASTAYIGKFNGLQDDIERMVAMVNEHSDDLSQMAQNYITGESQAAEEAQSLSADVIV